MTVSVHSVDFISTAAELECILLVLLLRELKTLGGKMKKATKILILGCTILVLGLYGCQQAAEREVGEAPAAEGEEYSWGGEAQKELKMAEGQLLRVDQEGKKLAIKKDDGAEMEFSFDDKTEIRGAQTTAQGLASETNAHVTVRYEDGFVTDTAKVIEIHAQGSSR